MCPAGCPLHLLLLHHAFADHLVHRRFNEGRADRLAVSVAFAEVRDELLIVADVGLEFAYTLGHLLHQWRRNLGKLQIDKEAFLTAAALGTRCHARGNVWCSPTLAPLPHRPPAVRTSKFSPAAAAR